MKNQFLWATGLMGAALLSGCGGGGGSDAPAPVIPPTTDPTPVTSVPASVGASTLAFTTYLMGLITSDTTEPLGTDLVTAPVSDTEEPMTVN